MRLLPSAGRYFSSVKDKLKHSEKSMGHAHVMALTRRPELAQNPSAHWQRRSNFTSSAAALRGEQLARAIKVFKLFLCVLHREQFRVNLDFT